MSDTSPILSLPLIQPAQAQKHVTHNEALTLLEAVVQMAVQNRDQTTPPPSPALGQRHIVAPTGASEAWLGQENAIAVWDGSSWRFILPQQGWRAEILSETTQVVFDGTDWVTPSLEGLDGVGIGTTSDEVNRLSVVSDATLLTHNGAGHQLKINKASATDTGALLFQTGWSGRAELGLNGSDNWSIKVSPDGTNWVDAVEIDAVTGLMGGVAVQDIPTTSEPGQLLVSGAFGLGSVGASAHLGSYSDAAGKTQFLADDEASALPDAPSENHAHAGVHLAATETRWVQMLSEVGGSVDAARLWVRRCYDGAVSEWQQIFSQGNILGAVSQNNGVPTGAIIERGTTADGEFVRFADGTLICTSSVTYDASLPSGYYPYSFPSSFVDRPACSFSPGKTNASANQSVISKMYVATTNSGWALYHDRNASAGTFTIYLTAIGRWF